MNLDAQTVKGFGEEWNTFRQSNLSAEEVEELFSRFFSIFPWDALPKEAVGFDMGCGSGRWARLVAKRVGRLYCIDASEQALRVAKENLAGLPNCEIIHASVDESPLTDASMDFGYSLGVLHHVPDTAAGIASCVKKLKPGAPFLCYLYYAMENRPGWYRGLWGCSNLVRRCISRMPFWAKYLTSQVIAAVVYYPLARLASLAERAGMDVSSFPLAFYRGTSFYVMRTDALDRFGTPLEQRFTAGQIRRMMEVAGLERIVFRDSMPCWCAVGYRHRET